MQPSELRSLWERRRATLRRLIEGIPEGHEAICAAPGAMPLVDHALHILSSEKTAVDALTVTPGQWQWETGIDSKHYPTQEAALRVLEEQTARTAEYFANLTPEKMVETIKLPWGEEPTVEAFWVGWLTHDAHHCGSMIATMRAGGIEPPGVWG